MPFTHNDFTPDNAQRLSVIIMKQMGKSPLTGFKSLPPTQQKKFNRIMNEYIQSLGEEWTPKLMSDFNQIVNEDILNEEFDPSKEYIPQVNTEKDLMLTEEQEEFFKLDENEGELDKIKNNLGIKE